MSIRVASYTNLGSWTSATTPQSTPAVDWRQGDIIVALIGNESGGATGNPTATGLAFTVQKNADDTLGTFCSTRVCTAVAAADGNAVVQATNVGAGHWGMGVFVVRGAQKVGGSFEQHTSTKTVSFTPTLAHSLVIFGVFDFAAGADTLTPTVDILRDGAVDGTAYSFWVGQKSDQPSAAAVPYGIVSSAAGPFSIIGVELVNTQDPILHTRPFPFKPGSPPSRSTPYR